MATGKVAGAECLIIRNIKNVKSGLFVTGFDNNWVTCDNMRKSDITSRRRALKNELKRVVNELKKAGVERIILFGSLARDDIGPASDIDLLVVHKTEKRFMERLTELYEIINPRYAIDILVYTPSEFAEMKEKSIFVKRILREGELLYEA
ncbi:MAG TPA: nucleotidyltransferase domain-containing protein [Candidatus Methanoperedenaceae archaeon]|nr:nucleotidyltransferase domain-containing protein [Candidatus Methanoperedenaceae archaeon]